MKKHSGETGTQTLRADMIAVSLIYVCWRIGLYGIEKIASFLWVERPGFLGLVTPWANFDGAHYTSIAKDGYGVFQFAFFPMYPLLIRLGHTISGLPYESVAVGISHIALFTGLFLFWRYLKGTPGRVWVIILFLVYPASFFFAAAYSESVFFALSIGVLVSLQNKRWILVGVLAGLASATRLVGVFLWLPIAIALWKDRQHLTREVWFALCMAPLGLVSYMGYLWRAAGDPLAFFHVQSAFGAGRSGSEVIFLPQLLWRYARIFMTVPQGEFLYHIAVLELSSLVFGAVLVVTAWRKRLDPGIILYSAGVILLPTLTGTLSSMPRYLLAAFPLFSVFGGLRPVWIKLAVLIVFLMLLVYATTGFLKGYFIS
ncbi:hypothetical protein HY949_01645 [Candidatus Gottesmanbacteria bacterium]|nr:hypothetical protein [Candidatus Gottesmanbacteria bacterium]